MNKFRLLTHMHAYNEGSGWKKKFSTVALGFTRWCEPSEKPHAYLLRFACCRVRMAACHAAVDLATVDVCAICSRKIRKILLKSCLAGFLLLCLTL